MYTEYIVLVSVVFAYSGWPGCESMNQRESDESDIVKTSLPETGSLAGDGVESEDHGRCVLACCTYY